jgi:glutaminyl-tRNA synthetase
MLYERLFNIENTADVPEGQTYLDFLNPDSLAKLEGAVVEPSLDEAQGGDKFQFVRVGYFCKDTKNEGTFNRIVGLKDSFPKK